MGPHAPSAITLAQMLPAFSLRGWSRCHGIDEYWVVHGRRIKMQLVARSTVGILPLPMGILTGTYGPVGKAC